jgi:hypothetical protein
MVHIVWEGIEVVGCCKALVVVDNLGGDTEGNVVA